MTWLRIKKDIGDIATGWVYFKDNILQEHNYAYDTQLKIDIWEDSTVRYFSNVTTFSGWLFLSKSMKTSPSRGRKKKHNIPNRYEAFL